MSLITASISVAGPADVDPALGRAAEAVDAGARLIEWRVDRLASDSGGAAAVIDLVKRSPAPCIVTCRLKAEGGEYDGGEAARAGLLAAVTKSDSPPRYIDLELASYQSDGILRKTIEEALAGDERDIRTALILSVHDFEGRPADLLQSVETMAATQGCAVSKVAWRARSIRSNLEALDLLAERAGPMIAVCMGPFGLMSRVLAGKFGGLLTYASLRADEATAPGQPTVGELGEIYRFGRIGPQTKVYGVFGWPVEQSLGPVIHNAGFEATGHDGVYLPLPIPPEYEHFKATVGALLDHRRLGFRGASVTSPHKENLVRFVRESGGTIHPASARIGAANTLIVNDDRSIECINTDAPAAVSALCAGMEIEPSALKGQRVAVLGAGGVARAIVAALSDAGAAVTIFNRTRARAEALVAELAALRPESGTPARVVVGDPDALGGAGGFDVLVNCTPVGMAGGPAAQESPLPDDVPLDRSVTVFETVYNPRRTPLFEQAESQGAKAIGGLDMFLRQAAMQFERWTGEAAPMEVFQKRVMSDQ